MRKRRTVAERRQQAYEADQRAWEHFLPRLRACASHADALELFHSPVGQNAPGRHYYSNFGFFMHYFAPPNGANGTELMEYLRLVDVFDAEGILKPGSRDEIRASFEAAMHGPRW